MVSYKDKKGKYQGQHGSYAAAALSVSRPLGRSTSSVTSSTSGSPRRCVRRRCTGSSDFVAQRWHRCSLPVT